MKADRHKLRSNECVDSFTVDALANFLPRTCRVKHKQDDERDPGFFKEVFKGTEMLCLCSKTYCRHDVTSNSAVKVSTNVHWKKADTDHRKSIVKSWTKKVKVTSNRTRGDSEKKHTVAAYEHVENGPFYFYAQREFETDVFHTERLNLLGIHSFFILNCSVFVLFLSSD